MNDDVAPEGPPSGDFPIVGIGASAGGLAACQELLRGLSVPTGLGFVLVQHLAADHASQFAAILSRSTSMEVVEATEGVKVEPDHLYVIPPATYMRLSSGLLRLEDPGSPPVPMPIDYFFRSLAEEHAELSAGVLLSGTGSDGSQGIRAIRGHGGITIAQDPLTAEYDAMPRNAIATGMVDDVSPIARIPALLEEYTRRGWSGRGVENDQPGDSRQEVLNGILLVVLAKTRNDFRCYKRATILRRVRRRMGLVQRSSLAEYLALLRSDSVEATELAKDLLIGVTSFFRDPEAFEALRPVLASRLDLMEPDTPLRVWIPGCATGEEAYSLVILLMEVFSSMGRDPRVQVFATDIDDSAVRAARVGVYPASIAADVSPERLGRFFVQEGEQFRVSKQVRDCVVFAVQNVVSSPAFSRMDLISCRNVLIYLEADAQKRVLTQFGRGLTPAGILFLGKSDGLYGMTDSFEPVSKRWRIFSARYGGPARAEILAWRPGEAPGAGFSPAERTRPEREPGAGMAGLAERAVLDALSAAIVIADRSGRIVHLQGTAGQFLEYPAGDPPYNLLDIAKGGLASRLRTAFRRVVKDGEEVRFAVPAVRDGRSRPAATVVVRMIKDRRTAEPLVFCVLAEAPKESPASPPPELPVRPDQESLVEQMESELRGMREDLQGTIGELETSNEELRASSEEVMSMNEELQSTNEELETSQEELQSLNEELATVNAELQDRLAQVTALNDDLSNLIGATEIATLFLDSRLHVKRYTPSATRIMNLIPSDVGRPIGDLTHKLEAVDVAADAQSVLDDLRTVAREVVDRSGSWYTMRVFPYRTREARVDGIVLTFTDVTHLKAADEATNTARLYAENIVESIQGPLLVVDQDRRIVSANVAFHHLFGNRPSVNGDSQSTIEADALREGPLRRLVDQVLADDRSQIRMEIELDVPGAGRRWMVVGARRMARQSPEGGVLYLIAFDDLTDERNAIASLALSEARLAVANESIQQVARLRALAGELTATEDRERRRVGRLLHDHVQQLLVAAKLHLLVVGSGRLDADLESSVALAVDLLDQSIEASRSLTVELSPPVLQDAGLAVGLEWLVRRVRDQHSLEVTLTSGGEIEPIDPPTRMFMFEAVRELLFNVVKHAGVREASVNVQRVEGRIVVTVEDRGRGMNPTALRGPAGPTPSFGLFTLQQRVELMGGTFLVEGAPGQGTRVTLSAPVEKVKRSRAGTVKEKPGNGAPPPSATEPAPSEGDPAPPARVLIVDDHALVRQALASVLRGVGAIEVVGEASNGREAVERTRELRPNVVVMDISMPVMNGIEATRQIVAEEPDVRVIGLSMHNDNEMSSSMRQAGAVDFVTKGGPVDVLIAAILSAHASRFGR